MIQAFYTGISGMRTGQSAIDIASDNIANINTVGFRASEADFASLFEEQLGTTSSSTNPNSIGGGVKLQASKIDLNEGAYENTDLSTDMAIQGDGWFGVLGEQGPLYTRAGNFTFDRNSDLVTPNGLYVLGSMGANIDFENGTLTNVLNEVPLKDVGQQEKLRFPSELKFPAVATSNAKFIGNLGSEDDFVTMGAQAIDAQNNKNEIQLEFTKSATQVLPGSQWDIKASVLSPNGDIVYDTQNATVSFNEDGSLEATSLVSLNNNGTQVAIDLGNGFDGITSMSSLSSSSSSVVDGTVEGDLVGYEINKNAEVTAVFSNGEQSAVGQVAVFHFQNDYALSRAGGASFSQSVNSGDPIIFKDENGVNTIGASVLTYKLETSNVTLEKSLTELIILQRTYDANSKSISAADEMMQKALQMSG